MLDRYLGILIIGVALASYILADMPVIQGFLGDNITSQLDYMKANISFLIPLALFLMYWRVRGLHPYAIGSIGILCIIVGVAIYLIQQGGFGL